MLVAMVAGAAALSAAERDYEPGIYANVRERAANTLKYAHSPNRMFEKIAAGKMSVGGYVGSRDPQVCEMAGMSGLDFERVAPDGETWRCHFNLITGEWSVEPVCRTEVIAPGR